MIKKVLWSSLLDYPKQISTVIFIGGCNWSCSYCQNKPLLYMKNENFDEILIKLISRKSIISHVVLSGGECTFSKNFNYYINKLKENGFKIGIHTNGENYEEIKNNIHNIDFIGLDVKTSFHKYENITNSSVNINNIKNTLKLLVMGNIEYDIRTTLFPKHVELEDLLYISNYIKKLGIKNYNIQKYIPLSENEYNYSNEDILGFEKELNKIIKTESRGLI